MRYYRYSRAILIAGVAANAAYAMIRAYSGAGCRQVNLREVWLTVSAAAADANIGLVRPATLGTSSAVVVPTAEAGAAMPGASSGIETGWSVQPTISGTPVWLRRQTFITGASATVKWTWDQDLMPLRGAAPGQCGLLLWNYGVALSAPIELTVIYDELQQS